MKINGTRTIKEKVDIETSVYECLKALFSECNVSVDVCHDDKGFYTSEDVSYHGSPCYERYDENPKDGTRGFVEELIKLRKLAIDCGLVQPYQFN